MPEFLERRYSAGTRWVLSIVSLIAYVFTKVSVTVYAGALVFKTLLPDTFGSPDNAFWVGAFATVAFFSVDEGEAHTLSVLRGQGWIHPVPGLALSLCLLSLAGLPPLFGFTAKFMVLRAAVNAGHVWLAILGAVQSLLIAFVSLRVIFTLYQEPGGSKMLEPKPSLTLTAAAALTAVGVVLAGLYPTPILTAARVAAINLVR